MQGSVNITGFISTNQPSGSNEAGTEYNNIQTIVEGTTIAKMPIISGTLNAQGGTIPDNNGSSTNVLAIVLGVCIPVGVISTDCFILSYRNNPLLRVREEQEQHAAGDLRVKHRGQLCEEDIRADSRRAKYLILSYCPD